MSSFFLWSGFVFSLLSHIVSWVLLNTIKDKSKEADSILSLMILFLTGVAVNAFGYLLFR